MKNITDRLSNYMAYKGLNPNKITVDAELSVGLIGKAIKSNKGLHSDTIEKILHVYSDLNPEWFITGKGEMLRIDNTNAKLLKCDCSEKITELEDRIKFYKEKIQFVERKLEDCEAEKKRNKTIS